MEKILKVLGSVRFQQLFVGLILLILGYYGVIDQELANLIAGFFGISVTIGTIDGLAKTKK